MNSKMMTGDQASKRRASTARRAIIYCLVLLILLMVGTTYACDAFRAQGLQDFGSFIASGRAFLEGRNPYSDQEPLVLVQSMPDIEFEIRNPNLNPPISVLLFALLAGFDPANALVAWRLCLMSLHLVSLFLLYRQGTKQHWLVFLWACSLFGLWNMVYYGQIYAILEMLIAVALVSSTKGHSIVSGLLIGLTVALKPNLAIWPCLLVLTGHLVTGLWALGSAAAVSSIPLVMLGPAIYRQWIEAISRYGGSFRGANGSIANLAVQVGLDPTWGYVLSLSLLGCVVWLIWHRRHPANSISEIGILLALLVGPIAWPGYALLVLPCLMTRKWDWPTYLAALLLAVPVLLPLWPIGWPMLILLIRALWRMTRPQPTSESEMEALPQI